MRRSWPTILAAAAITLATTIPVVATADDYAAASPFAFALGAGEGSGLG